MNHPIRRLLFAALLLTHVVVVITTTRGLPDQVASHFGPGGHADGFMGRAMFQWFALGFGVALPVLMVWLVGSLPGMLPEHTNVPNRAYWMAPERQQATLNYLSGHAVFLGCLMVGFVMVVHLLVVQANRAEPPRLDGGYFWPLFVGFLVGLGGWIAVMLLHFSRVPADDGAVRGGP